MPSLFADLVPLIIGSALGPGQIIFDTLLLQSPDRGVLKAGSFVGGMSVVRLIQGIVFGFVLTATIGSAHDNSKPGTTVSTLLLVLGIFLLITAYRQWQNEDDPDGPPPKWLKMIDSVTPVKAFGIGFILVATSANLWVFTLSAIAVIGEAQLNQLAGSIAFLLFMLLAETLVLLPILLRIIRPEQATKDLNAVSAWLIKHNQTLMSVISLVLGLYFLAKGIGRFLA